MEEISKGSSGAADDNASGNAGDHHADSQDKESKASGRDSVSYETYRKTLGQLKSMQAKLQEVTELAESLKDEKLAAEGKKEELVESYKKKYEDERTKRATQLRAFADEIVFRQFEAEAAKLGCIKSEDLFTLYKPRVQELNVADDLKVDTNEIRQIIEDAKLERPFYFKKDSPKLSTDLPGDVGKSKMKNIKDMSIDELRATYRRMSAQT